MVIKNRLHCQAGPGSNTYSTTFQLCDLNLFRAQCLHLPDWAFTTYGRGKAAKNGRELGRGGYCTQDWLHRQHSINSSHHYKLFLKTIKQLL